MERTRTITWDDTSGSLLAAASMTGIEYMRAIAAGELPAAPIARLIGMAMEEINEGLAVFSIEPAEYLYNPIGSVHGGVAATVLDSVMGCAIHTTLPQGTAYSTVELSVNYVRPITAETPRLFGRGEVVHAGRRLATAEARLTDADGRLYAHGTTTCLVMKVGPAQPGQ
jgi:uncharacterized protein (TIGR00369 family)